MRLFQLTKQELRNTNIGGKGVVVESQNYGQDEDLLYHVAVSNSFGDFLTETNVGREISDTGRTPGFWQNIGGRGIYKPNSVNPIAFSSGLVSQLKKTRQGEVSIEGETWNDILNNFPGATKEGKAALDINVSHDKVEIVKKEEKTSPKKTSRKKKSATTK